MNHKIPLNPLITGPFLSPSQGGELLAPPCKGGGESGGSGTANRKKVILLKGSNYYKALSFGCAFAGVKLD
jgi:hypothetical protein